MKAKKEKYESVKIETEVMDRVRRYVKQSRQTISGFISAELEEVLDSRENTVPTKTEYFASMGLALMKESNKKKK
jgi:hypothetical protein